MKRYLTFFICFQLFFTSISWGKTTEELSCSISLPSQSLLQSEKNISQICLKALSQKNLPPDAKKSLAIIDIFPMIGECLFGAGKAIGDEARGIAYFVKLFIKEIPTYTYEKVKNLFTDEDDAINSINQLSQENISLIDKAKNLAKQFYEEFKKFLTSMSEMIKTEFQSFFCYPPAMQSAMLCRLISNGFLVVFSPLKFLKGAKWTSEMAKSVKTLMKTIIESGGNTEKLATKIEHAAEALKLGEKYDSAMKVISKLDDESSIVSKEVGEDTVYYLQSTVKGEKALREMVLDEHTKFFSIQGQGKKVIDKLISRGSSTAGAIMIIDLNNLGIVNYFLKGLSAGDEYLKTVSDAIRNTIINNTNIKGFRTGGDEISLLLEGTSADEVYKLSKRLSRNIVADPKIQKLFNEEREAIAKKLAIAQKENNQERIKELLELSEKMKKFDGSVSIGSHMFKAGDDYASSQTIVNIGLSKAKATYKKAIGLPFEKYGAPASDLELDVVNGKFIPPVFMPN